ncbi:hypothetical protein GWR56_02860 [Mucilaginibacter sp. 14171R-50]|uniref:hypothetical protein n=1 Tax=Mucilaginibacter sp. 14171R-50 TaxID=2703789 RepID=UPI00138B6DF5|nr:hypothetical protein [Mucilaginibacter sp. 14171R-50]QHS54536.1 hypothetical protein GWR56_02860 [Mucilaginibacter sp. 14171R-50]
MRKIVIGIAIVGSIVVVAVVCRVLYMIACISCTFPPIREYECACSIERLEVAFSNYSKQKPNIKFKASIRDSSNTQVANYRDIQLALQKDSTAISYSFVCDVISEEKTYIKLVSVESFTGKAREYKGGYGINAIGAKELLNDLEKDFLPGFIKDQRISIVAR